MATAQDPQLYFHVRIVMGMVLGLSMTRLLSGTAKCFQNPKRYGLSLLHLGWVFALFLNAILFWWWEFNLINIPWWTFEIYFFVVLYTSLIYFTCVYIFPEELPLDSTLESYFMENKISFFCVMSLSSLVSFIDVLIKGQKYVEFSFTFVMGSSILLFILFILAAYSSSKIYHYLVMCAFLAVQLCGVVWLLRTVGLR